MHVLAGSAAPTPTSRPQITRFCADSMAARLVTEKCHALGAALDAASGTPIPADVLRGIGQTASDNALAELHDAVKPFWRRRDSPTSEGFPLLTPLAPQLVHYIRDVCKASDSLTAGSPQHLPPPAVANALRGLSDLAVVAVRAPGQTHVALMVEQVRQVWSVLRHTLAWLVSEAPTARRDGMRYMCE